MDEVSDPDDAAARMGGLEERRDAACDGLSLRPSIGRLTHAMCIRSFLLRSLSFVAFVVRFLLRSPIPGHSVTARQRMH
jgi:hypothetical protein